MKKRYKIGDKIFNIPDTEVSAFLKDNPEAVEVKFYEVGDKKYNIPLDQTSDFEKEMGLSSPVEKKNPVGTASSNGSKAGGPFTSTSPLQSIIENANEQQGKGDELQRSIASAGGQSAPTKADPSRKFPNFTNRGIGEMTPEEINAENVSKNPYSPVLDVINKVRPNQPEVRASLYNQIVGDIESGDEGRLKNAKTEFAKLKEESNPDVITPADKIELLNLTGTDDPASQLDVINARLGGAALNPAVNVDLASLPAADSEKLGVLRDKLAFNTNPQAKKNTTWSNKSVLTKGGEQTTDAESFFSSFGGLATLGSAAIVEAKRYNEEKLNDSFSTGLESIKLSDPARYKRAVDAITNGKPLATTDVVDLTAIGTRIIQRQNSQAIVDGKIDADQYTAEQESLAKDQEQNVYGHPDFLRSVMADVIGNHYEKRGTIVAGPWMITDKEIDAVPKEKFLAQGLDPNNPEFKKQLEFLKEKEGWFPFQNSIAKDDLLREFRKGALSTFSGVVSTAGAVAADITDTEDDLMLDAKTKQFGVSDVANKRGKYFDEHYGKVADAFSGFGQFASQLALMYAGGTAATAAGEALGGGTAAARLLGASNVQKLGNLLVDNAQLYGTYGTSFVQSYGDYFKDALAKGANPLHAKMMAFTNASMEGVSETIFDNVKFGKQVAKDLLDKRNFDKIAKVFDRGVWDDLAKKEYSEIVQGVASGVLKTLKTVGKAAGAAAKESFEEVPVAITNFVVDAADNPANAKGRSVLLEAKDAFMNGLVSFSIPSLLGLAGGLRQQLASEKSANENLMIAAMQQPYMTESINRLVQAGDITQEQANQKLKIVNTAAQELQRIPKVNSEDKPLTPAERENYLSLSVREKVLSNSLENADQAEQKIINGKIADILTQKDAILSKPVAEVVKEVAAETTQAAAPTLFERTKSALIAKQESKEDNEGNRLQLESFKNATEEDVMTGAVQQAVDAPESAVSQFNGDRALVTDLIAQNDEQAINDSIKKWQDRAKSFVPAGNTEEEQTASFNEMNKDVKLNLAALREGLAKKQEQAKVTTTEEATVSEPLKDVESTINALLDSDVAQTREGFAKLTDLIDERKFNDTDSAERVVAEEYHKAKKDGTNPDLVKAVEKIFPSKQIPTTKTEPTVSENKDSEYQSKLNELDNKYGVEYAASLSQLIDLLKPRRLSAGDYALLGENIYIPRKNLKAYRGELAEIEKAKPQAKEVIPSETVTPETTTPATAPVEEVAPVTEQEPMTATVSRFEHPSMEYPVHKVSVGGKDRFIQRQEGMNPSETAWYEVVKDKTGNWSSRSKGEDGWLGFTKKEAVDRIVGEREAEKAAKPKVRVTAEQLQAGQPGQVERKKISDALFDFADKIAGAGEKNSALTNLFKIPQELLARAVRLVAKAIQDGEDFVDAIKKGIELIRGEKEQVDEGDFTGLVESIMAGEKPKMGTATAPSFTKMAGIASDKEYEVAMDTNEPLDPIAAYHMTRAADLPKMFGADKTQQQVFDSLPSDERFRAQMDMIQDGKALMAAAQSHFGSTDIMVYGPQLFEYIQRMSNEDVGLTNKKAVMLATLLGEIKQAVLTNKNPESQDALRRLDRIVSTRYNQFMHVTAKNLSAARLLRVFRDKYMADIFHDKILEEQEIRERNQITEDESETEISDQDALAHQEKPREKPDVKAQATERKKKQAEADQRKKSPKSEFEKKANELEDDIKKKYGGKNKLIEQIIDKIKKLNCK